jgi:hypothetical protein
VVLVIVAIVGRPLDRPRHDDAIFWMNALEYERYLGAFRALTMLAEPVAFVDWRFIADDPECCG